MSNDRAEIVHRAFVDRLRTGELPVPGKAARVDVDTLVTLAQAQFRSRHLDRVARDMQKAGQGFYTIGSSGHEGSAAIALALRTGDPAFLHYRDGAFQLARAAQAGHAGAVQDMALSFAASADDPISGGRHKVLGSKQLNIPPQTSTIASHLPKAVGAAHAIAMTRRMPPSRPEWAADAIAYCSFGDASLNHATAQTALNAAGWAAWQGAPMPVLFGCEDNGIGISVKSPTGWVAARLQALPGIRYFTCDGLDVADTLARAREAADWVRRHRKPAVLHMTCVRLYGHAGADVEAAYRPQAEIDAAEARDPLLTTAARLIEAGQGADSVLALYNQIEAEVRRACDQAVTRPRLQTANEVMASIIPPSRPHKPRNAPSSDDLRALYGAADTRALSEPQPMAKLINLGLAEEMLANPDIVVMGEDVGRKGGVYGVTKGLQAKFGPARVMDTLLDETTILGNAIGMAQQGFLPMPEIQFLAYLHNAEDQLRGEAATLPFFSDGQYSNPMVVRIAGLGYQKGFGGHFHNDNSLAVLRDIPGLILGVPSNGADAVRMYRHALRLARDHGRLVVMVEPIALYPMRDLHAPDDGGWMRRMPERGQETTLDEVGVTGAGRDLAIVTYGNGAYLATQALPLLAEQGVDARVVDLRWLSPLPLKAMLAATADCAKILVVDECRASGGPSEAIVTVYATRGINVGRHASQDSFIATGPAYAATMPSRDSIIRAAL